MSTKRYYPYVPWDDVPVNRDRLDHDNYVPEWLDYSNVRGVRLHREGIYGPLAQIFRYLTAQDNKLLIADTRVLGVLEPA